MNPASSVGVWTSFALVKGVLVKANGTQKVIESFSPIFITQNSNIYYSSLFVTFHFQGKSDGPNLIGSTIRLFPRDILCVCGAWEGGERLFFSLVSLRSSVTWAGHRPTDTNSLRELTALTGLRSARVWRDENLCLDQCMFVKHLQGCVCHTRASNFGFFTT